MENGLLSTDQAASILGIKKPTLYSWVNQRKIPHYKIGRLVRFDQKELERWVSEQKIEAYEI